MVNNLLIDPLYLLLNSPSPPYCCNVFRVNLYQSSTLLIFNFFATESKNAKEPFYAAFGASLLTRYSAQLAFEKYGRGTTTPDLISHISPAFMKLFPSNTNASQL